MPSAYQLGTKVLRTCGSLASHQNVSVVLKLAAELEVLSESDLTLACRSEFKGSASSRDGSDELGELISGVGRRIWGGFTRRRARRLALAVEAFRRHPADLPDGSSLYVQQVQAAMMLCHQCLVQMETGEGKTYAVLPAAFALACEFGQVIIICANSYLAHRDASRTRSFWEQVGLSVGFVPKRTSAECWMPPVVYTTLDALMVWCLDLDLKMGPDVPRRPRGAALLDEADAILLDSASTPFSLVQLLEAEAFQWEFACSFVDELPQDEVKVDLSELDACLTPEAEKRLRGAIGVVDTSNPQFLLARHAVERAWIARHCVRADIDFVVKDRRVHPIDRMTGAVLWNQRLSWTVPLEFLLGFDSTEESRTIHRLSPGTVLQGFEHLCGMSGSLEDDALEYLLGWNLPVLWIPPRLPRRQTRMDDEVYVNRPAALEAAAIEVRSCVQAGRPVLVGTQTIRDAEDLVGLLRASNPPMPRLALLTGKNEEQIAEVLAGAGECSTVTVATQLAGRGVDIRPSEAAVANGGMHLICLGHSLDLRHDSQFMGRVGRQGAPCSVHFICSLEDALLQLYGGESVGRLFEKLAVPSDEPIIHRWVTQAISRAQGRFRDHGFLRRRGELLDRDANEASYNAFQIWIEHLQLPAAGADVDHAGEVDTEQRCSVEFAERASRRFVDSLMGVSNAKVVTREQADAWVREMQIVIGTARSRGIVRPEELEGRSHAEARTLVAGRLVKRIQVAWAANEHRVARSHGDLDEGVEVSLAGPQLDQPDSVLSTGTDKGTDKVSDKVDFLGWTRQRALLRVQRTRIRRRHPRRIALRTLVDAWSAYLDETSRIRFRLSLKNLSTLERYRLYADSVRSEWKNREERLAIALVVNWIRGENPEELDDVFLMDDRASDSAPRTEEHAYRSEVFLAGSGTEVQEEVSETSTLIESFLEAYRNRRGHLYMDESLVRRLLLDFAETNRWARLQTPFEILDALEHWGRLELQRGVAPNRCRDNRKVLKDFLEFLNHRGVIGPLPRPHHAVKRILRTVWATLHEQHTAISLVGVALFLAGFVFLSWKGRIADPKSLGPVGLLLERAIFGGLAELGTVTAAAFPAMLGSRWLAARRKRKSQEANRGQFWDVAVTTVIGIVLAWWLAPAAGAGWLGFGASVLIFLAILLATMFFARVAWLLESHADFPIESLWILYALAGALIPWLQVTTGQPFAVAGFSVLGFAAWLLAGRWNRVEIPLVSVRIAETGSTLRSEDMHSVETVRVWLGPFAHLMAVALAWSIGGLVPVSHRASLGEWREVPLGLLVLQATTYVGVVSAWAWVAVSGDLSPTAWHQRLNRKYQLVEDLPDLGRLDRYMSNLKRRMVTRQAGVHILVTLAACVVLGPVSHSVLDLPLAILLVAVAGIGATQAQEALPRLRRLLVSRVPVHRELFALPEPEEVRRYGFWGRLANGSTSNLALVLTSVVLVFRGLSVLSDIQGIASIIRDAWTWIVALVR